MSFLETTLNNQFRAEPHDLTLGNDVRLEFWETGVLRVIPAHQSSEYRVVISSGIHGNETAPMEIVEQLFCEIKNQQLVVNNELLFIIGNPPAANKAQRFIDENLNRLFLGAHQNSGSNYERRRAAILEGFTQRFFEEGDEPRLHYDLHTAIRGSQFEKFVVYPFLHERDWSQRQIGFLEACGIQALLLSNKPSTTYSYFTSTQFSADAFTVELGSVKPFGENHMPKFERIIEGLRRVIRGNEHFDNEPREIKTFAVVEEVVKLSDDFKLNIPDDAKNFTEYPKGSVLASDQGYQYTTQQDGERFVFPISNVPIGQRAMLVVAPSEL